MLFCAEPQGFAADARKHVPTATQQDERVDQCYWEAGSQCGRALKDEKWKQFYG